MDIREVFTIDGRRFSNMAGFYDEVERVFTFGLDWKIGRNLNAFNDILRGGFGRHEYGQPIHIQWLAYEKSVRNLGKETMDTIVEIILDSRHEKKALNTEQPPFFAILGNRVSKAVSKGLIFRMFRQSEKIRKAENPDKSMVFGV